MQHRKVRVSLAHAFNIRNFRVSNTIPVFRHWLSFQIQSGVFEKRHLHSRKLQKSGANPGNPDIFLHTSRLPRLSMCSRYWERGSSTPLKNGSGNRNFLKKGSLKKHFVLFPRG